MTVATNAQPHNNASQHHNVNQRQHKAALTKWTTTYRFKESRP